MKKLALLFIVLAPFSLWSQDNFTIQSDRPGIGYNANTVGKGVVLHQFGYQWSRTHLPLWYNDGHDFTSNLRIGILKDLEAHWNINLNHTYTGTNLPEEDPRRQFILKNEITGISLNSFGARYTFLRGEKWKPTMAVMGDIETPLVNETYRSGLPTGSVLLITNWSFPNNLFWGITTGITSIGRTNTIPYAINIGGNIGSKWSVFGEYYGSFSAYKSNNISYIAYTNGVDAGFTYLMNKNIVLDFFGGWQDINDEGNFFLKNSFFLSAGITWAIQAWNK